MRTALVLSTALIVLATLACPTSLTSQDETLKELVKPAIERGVQFLRNSQTKLGTWEFGGSADPTNKNVIGATALCAIALMESGVPSNDRQIQAAASVVRKAVSNPNFNYNYTICLCVLFLDRINRDRNMTQSDKNSILRLANLIAKGQHSDGGWGYDLPFTYTDNSNTQFAVVALWVARKHGKPGGAIDAALSLCEKKFRKSQRADGGWGYDTTYAVSIPNPPTGSMTCAGILGIALHAGAATQSQSADFRGAGSSGSTDVVKRLDTDEQIVKARAYIMQSLFNFINGNPKEGHISYFFWSLERVATLYRWRKIDGVDWFEVGSKFLMSKQTNNGGWSMDAHQGPFVDTAFCLLFLSKSNLLGSLQEADFTAGSIGSGPTLNMKKAEPKKTDSKSIAKDLMDELLKAPPPRQAEILQQLSDTPGTDYGIALLDAIGKLNTNTSKELAREALAQRFKRMKTETLAQNTQSDDREVRLAAAIAIRLKDDRENMDGARSLIPLLADQDVGVSAAALESLKVISGQDFGKSVDRWNRWLESAKTRKPE
ncbi:MAG: terpene cyclase/mutase family protein [Planctomycetia bacterium]|nr:terpene cyclase/mutase family protein [Planctomycetia bacterium]